MKLTDLYQRLAFLSSFGPWQLIQNLAPSSIIWRQCDIEIVIGQTKLINFHQIVKPWNFLPIFPKYLECVSLIVKGYFIVRARYLPENLFHQLTIMQTDVINLKNAFLSWFEYLKHMLIWHLACKRDDFRIFLSVYISQFQSKMALFQIKHFHCKFAKNQGYCKIQYCWTLTAEIKNISSQY